MKKILFLFAVVLLCLTGMAKDPGGSWIITDHGKMDCKKIRLGYNKARIISDNGQKNTVAFNAIRTFSWDGRLFTKLRIYDEGRPTKMMAFMELIKTCGDFSLYRLQYYDLGSANPNAIIYRYFLYRGEKLHLALNEVTLANICVCFGLNYDDI